MTRNDGSGASSLRPIRELLELRSGELQLGKADLVRRWGYANMGKGLRRLDQLKNGDFVPNKDLTGRLARALELPEAAVLDAIVGTQKQLEEERDEVKYRE